MLINLVLNSGTGKTGNPWYQARVIAGKYKSEPLFISELEYDYLTNLLEVDPAGKNLLDENELEG